MQNDHLGNLARWRFIVETGMRNKQISKGLFNTVQALTRKHQEEKEHKVEQERKHKQEKITIVGFSNYFAHSLYLDI